jgi:hypothetical protein
MILMSEKMMSQNKLYEIKLVPCIKPLFFAPIRRYAYKMNIFLFVYLHICICRSNLTGWSEHPLTNSHTMLFLLESYCSLR